jgi:hypothetical protein
MPIRQHNKTVCPLRNLLLAVLLSTLVLCLATAARGQCYQPQVVRYYDGCGNLVKYVPPCGGYGYCPPAAARYDYQPARYDYQPPCYTGSGAGGYCGRGGYYNVGVGYQHYGRRGGWSLQFGFAGVFGH